MEARQGAFDYFVEQCYYCKKEKKGSFLILNYMDIHTINSDSICAIVKKLRY